MTKEDYQYLKIRDVATDPQSGDVAGGRELPRRTVTGRFIDACNQPYVIYTVEVRIPVKSWTRWFRRTGARPQ